MCPGQESNQWPFGLQAGTQSTEPLQPGLKTFKSWQIQMKLLNPFVPHAASSSVEKDNEKKWPWLAPLIKSWIDVTRMDILIMFLILEGKHPIFTIKYTVSCGGFVEALYQLGEISFSFWFVECHYHERVLDFIKCFFSVCWDDCVTFVFYSLDVIYYINRLSDVKPTFILKLNPHPRGV